MKDHMVLAVEEENFALGTADLAAKGLCELYCGKAWLRPLGDRRASNLRADTPRESPDGLCPQALDLEFRLVLVRIFQAAPVRRLRQWKGLRHAQHSFAAAECSRARDNERGNAWFPRGWYR